MPSKRKTDIPPSPPPSSPEQAERILVLQGGGALGAYQGGVLEVLCETGLEPHWVAGISIGAINAALYCGNPPHQRSQRLREFWELLSSGLPSFAPHAGVAAAARGALNEFSATQVMLFGVPGFFKPRVPPAPLQPRGTPEAISFYDTSALRETLERLVDFDRINHDGVRLSVGAVNVRTGNFAYFDSSRQTIDARHIMASGALPPGFAPVEIDGEQYWDGGLVSNTPLQYVLDQPGKKPRLVLQVDLFAARGELPQTLADVTEREKDIRFSSRTRMATDHELDRYAMAQAAQRLLAKLPAEWRDDPDAKALAALRPPAPVDIAHLIYRSKHYETQSKDYEFSRLSMQEHWDAGRADMTRTLAHRQQMARHADTPRLRVFDLGAAQPTVKAS
jgi:NTE family protein